MYVLFLSFLVKRTKSFCYINNGQSLDSILLVVSCIRESSECTGTKGQKLHWYALYSKAQELQIFKKYKVANIIQFKIKYRCLKLEENSFASFTNNMKQMPVHTVFDCNVDVLYLKYFKNSMSIR